MIQKKLRNHMKVKNKLFESFNSKIDRYLNQLLKIEPSLVKYNPHFAIGDNLMRFDTTSRKALFKLLFNEELFEFLEEKLTALLAGQRNTLKTSILINNNRPESLELPQRPSQLDNLNSNFTSRVNLDDKAPLLFLDRTDSQLIPPPTPSMAIRSEKKRLTKTVSFVEPEGPLSAIANVSNFQSQSQNLINPNLNTQVVSPTRPEGRRSRQTSDSISSKDLALNVTRPVSSTGQQRNTIEAQYKSLSNVFFRLDTSIVLSKLPKKERLVSINKFQRSKEMLREHPYNNIFMRARFLSEVNLFQRIKEKQVEQTMEPGSPTSPKKMEKSGGFSSVGFKLGAKKKTQKALPKSNHHSENLEMQELEKKIKSLIANNTLFRIFANLVKDKNELFALDFKEEPLKCLILAFFEALNQGKLPEIDL